MKNSSNTIIWVAGIIAVVIFALVAAGGKNNTGSTSKSASDWRKQLNSYMAKCNAVSDAQYPSDATLSQRAFVECMQLRYDWPD